MGQDACRMTVVTATRVFRCGLPTGHKGLHGETLGIFTVEQDTSGIPRPIDVQPTSPTISVPDLTTPELAALMIAGQEPDAVPCAKCGFKMDVHPIIENDDTRYRVHCESYIDPDFNSYQDSDDE